MSSDLGQGVRGERWPNAVETADAAMAHSHDQTITWESPSVRANSFEFNLASQTHIVPDDPCADGQVRVRDRSQTVQAKRQEFEKSTGAHIVPDNPGAGIVASDHKEVDKSPEIQNEDREAKRLAVLINMSLDDASERTIKEFGLTIQRYRHFGCLTAQLNTLASLKR